MPEIETDYLVVGAGASGMAFTDALIAASDAEVVMVDRRHRPGGHWNDDYPFVRLHQPSALYGVASRPLGQDRIDEAGINAGFYERATAAEICDYYGRVLDEHRFHLRGAEPLAGNLDRVVRAAEDVPQPVIVDGRPVAMDPDVFKTGPVGLKITLLILPEATSHANPGGPNHQLAHLVLSGSP